MTVVATFASFGMAPTAQADPGPGFRLAVDRHAVHGGEQLTAIATAATGCTWLLEWDGERRVAQGRSLTTSFVAPAVSRPTRIALHGTCFYRGVRPSHSSARGTLAAYVPPSWRHDTVVTVLPPGVAVSAPHASGGPGRPGGLPGTGGPSALSLLAGLLLVVAGSVLVRRSTPRVVTA
jgi:hypothetical protein